MGFDENEPRSRPRAVPTHNPLKGGIAMDVSTAIERFFEYQRANCYKKYRPELPLFLFSKMVSLGRTPNFGVSLFGWG